MSLDNETLKNIHSARGEFYAFFSRLFSNVPNNELYQMLSDISPKLKSLAGNTENMEIKTGAEGIIDFLEKRNALSGVSLSDFDLERARHYTAMFCMPKSIPTDESVYTSPEHMERQNSHDQVIALFKKYNMWKTNKFTENEDFIGYELLFLSKLAYDCAEFIKAGKADDYRERLQAQYDFHINHTDKWLYDFYNTVINYGIEDEILYKYFANLARGFMREDKLTLSEMLSVCGTD